MGQCEYTLVHTENFTIKGENVPCDGSISQVSEIPPSIVIFLDRTKYDLNTMVLCDCFQSIEVGRLKLLYLS